MIKNIILGLLLVLLASCNGAFCSEALYQASGPVEPPYAPVGCKATHGWRNYDCGDGGIGFCQKRVDKWLCDPSVADMVAVAAEAPAHDIEEVKVITP